MKIVQLLPSLAYGDAIGNDVMCMDEILREEGYETHIYADYLGAGIDKKTASLAGDLAGGRV